MEVTPSNCRIEVLNLAQVWSLASATVDQNLIDACIPLIVANFEAHITDETFLCQTEVQSMKTLLNSPHSECIDVERKLKAVGAWLKAPQTDDDRNNRAGRFEDLLSMLDMTKLSTNFMLDVAAGIVDFELPNTCKMRLLQVWKSAQQSSVNHNILSNSRVLIPRYISHL